MVAQLCVNRIPNLSVKPNSCAWHSKWLCQADWNQVMESRVPMPSQVGNLVLLTLNMLFLELVWKVLSGAKLVFTWIKDFCIAFSFIMANSISLLSIAFWASVFANAFLVSFIFCKAAPSFALINLLSMFLAVISHFSYTISFAVASST